jgi:hypothetical protein
MIPEDSHYHGYPYDPFEKTLETHTSEKPKEEFTPGVYSSCYLCSRQASGLSKDFIVTLLYTKPITKTSTKVEKYVMTYCIWCYNSFIKK